MERDMDMIRDLLLEIEANQNINGRYALSERDFGVRDADAAKVQYHLRLMMDVGMLEGWDRNSLKGLDQALDMPIAAGTAKQLTTVSAEQAWRSDATLRDVIGASDNSILITRMTWEGHEFLETVRDEKVWQQTKVALNAIKGGGIETVKQIASAAAKGFIKTQVMKHTGIELDF